MSQENVTPKKTKTKLFAILGVLILLTGGIMFSVGMTRMDWDFTKLDHEELTAAEFTSESGSAFDTINLKGDWNYEIVRGDAFKVDYYTSNLAAVTVSETLNEETGKAALNLTEDWSGVWYYRWFGLVHGVARGQVKVVVTVTGDEAITLTVEGFSTRVNAESLTFKNIHINASSADINLVGVTAENITLKGSSLDAELDGVTAKAVVLDGSSADLRILNGTVDSLDVTGSSVDVDLTEGTAVLGRVFVDGSSADLTMVDSSAADIRIEGSSVDFEGERVDIQNSFYGDGSSMNADIELIGTAADIGRVRATGSSVRARVDLNGDGDFSREERFDEDEVYNGAGTKTFEVHGSSADLDITFAA